jgi:hypothetical protein
MQAKLVLQGLVGCGKEASDEVSTLRDESGFCTRNE